MARIRTLKEAHAEAVKRWGKTAMVEDRKGVSSKASRDEASELLRVHRAAKPEIRPIEEWPEDMSLGSYRAEIRAAQERRLAWRDEENRLVCAALRYRYAVGIGGIGFFVKGQGDTWEAAFAAADSRS